MGFLTMLLIAVLTAVLGRFALNTEQGEKWLIRFLRGQKCYYKGCENNPYGAPYNYRFSELRITAAIALAGTIMMFIVGLLVGIGVHWMLNGLFIGTFYVVMAKISSLRCHTRHEKTGSVGAAFLCSHCCFQQKPGN